MEHLIWYRRILAEIYGREPKPVPVPPKLEAALAETEVAAKAEECTGPDVVSAAVVSEEIAGLH